MNVDLMRKIDYYAGVPLCFFTSLARAQDDFPREVIDATGISGMPQGTMRRK